MSRALLVLWDDSVRKLAHAWIDQAPKDTRVLFQGPKRTLDQNSKMWVTLTKISVQARHHGLRLSPDDWKLLFLDALKREVRMAPNLDGTGFVSLGRSSSDLSKEEMSGLITILQEWCARNGVLLGDEEQAA